MNWIAVIHPETLRLLLDGYELTVRRCRRWYWRAWYWLRCRWTEKDTENLRRTLREFGREVV